MATVNTNQIGIGTSSPSHPLHIEADDPPNSSGAPVAQVLIDNPTGQSNISQTNIEFATLGQAIGWVGITSNTYSYGPFPGATYLENYGQGGVILLADDPVNGIIRFYAGGYTSATYERMRITPAGVILMAPTPTVPAGQVGIGVTTGPASDCAGPVTGSLKVCVNGAMKSLPLYG